MANLITEKQKKVLKEEYNIRLISVALLIASLFGIFVVIYTSLYYVSILRNDILVSEQLRNFIELENKENTGKKNSQIVFRLSEQVKIVEFYENNKLTASSDFNKIISNKDSSIRINRLSFNQISKEQGQFLVSGIAKNRESLVFFIEKIKSVKDFKSIESPISDFAKNSDIAFTINIKTGI